MPYSHLADFFYVWLKRILGDRLPDLFKTPLCPKGPEIAQDRPHRLSNSKKTKEYFEQEMGRADRCQMQFGRRRDSGARLCARRRLHGRLSFRRCSELG